MTAAYAYAPQEGGQNISGPPLRLVEPAHAQGQEARKMRDNMRAISLGATARGQSLESAKLAAAVHELAAASKASIEALQEILQGRNERDELSYGHVPPKPAFSVRATYKFVGKLKPRQFPVDE